MKTNVKLILNNVEYNHFEIAVPLSGFEYRHMVSGLRYQGTVRIPRSEELASVTVFTDNEKITVLSEWFFEKSSLETTGNIIVIKDAVLVQPAPRV